MKGWQFEKTHQPLKLIEKADPKPDRGQVLINVKAAGICHTDVTIMDNPDSMNFAKPPVILGHECAGVIEAVGPDITDFKVGDRVGANPVPKAANANGITTDGAFADKEIMPTAQLVKLPDTVSFVQGAAGTDAGMTSYHAVFGHGEAKPGMKVGIIGIGGLGEFGAGMAVAAGCEVYAADPKPEAREIAKKLGVKNVYKDISEMEDVQPQLIVDFAGSGTTTADALKVIAPAGKIVVVGVLRSDTDISTTLLTLKQATVVGSAAGDNNDIAGVYKYMSQGNFKPELKVISFEDIPNGIDQLRAGKVAGRLIASRA